MERFALKINNTVKTKLYNICRLCGIDSPNKVAILGDTVLLISDEDDFVEEPLYKKIFNCVGIQVTSKDQMPKTICGLCFDKINDFYEFREMCKSTNVQTRKLLGLKEIATEGNIQLEEIFEPKNITGFTTLDKCGKKRGRKRKNNFQDPSHNKTIKEDIDYKDIEYSLDDKSLVIPIISSKNTNINKKILSRNNDKIKTESKEVKIDIKTPKTYACNICNSYYLSTPLLQSHLSKSHVPQIDRYHCVTCNESLTNTIEIKNHNLWHKLTKTPYKCGLCSSQIFSLNGYTRHLRDCNKNVYLHQKVLPNIECVKCHLNFETKNLFYFHKCITSKLKCPKCNCKISNQNKTFKHIACCSAKGKNDFEFVKILIKKEPADIEYENFVIQRSSVISLSESGQPFLTMIYGTKTVQIKQCSVVISYDINLAAQKLLMSTENNFKKSKKSSKIETTEAIKRCDTLLKATMETLVNIKREPVDSLPIVKNCSVSLSQLMQPMVSIKQEMLDVNYRDCDIQIKQEIQELKEQPALKLTIKKESGTLNSSIVEKYKKQKNETSKKNKKLKHLNKNYILNRKIATNLPIPFKEEVIEPDYNLSTDDFHIANNDDSDSAREIVNTMANITEECNISNIIVKKEPTDESNSINDKIEENKIIQNNPLISQLLSDVSSEQNIQENMHQNNKTEDNTNVNEKQMSTHGNLTLKISSVLSGVNISNNIIETSPGLEFNIFSIKKEKDDPGYSRCDSNEINYNIDSQNTTNIYNEDDFDYGAVNIKEEIEINHEKFNDEVETESDSYSSSEDQNLTKNKQEINKRMTDVLNILEKGKITSNPEIIQPDVNLNTDVSKLKILKEKPFIEEKVYENLNSWDQYNLGNEYDVQVLTSQEKAYSKNSEEHNRIDESCNNTSIIENIEKSFLVISAISSGNAVNITNLTDEMTSNMHNEDKRKHASMSTESANIHKSFLSVEDIFSENILDLQQPLINSEIPSVNVILTSNLINNVVSDNDNEKEKDEDSKNLSHLDSANNLSNTSKPNLVVDTLEISDLLINSSEEADNSFDTTISALSKFNKCSLNEPTLILDNEVTNQPEPIKTPEILNSVIDEFHSIFGSDCQPNLTDENNCNATFLIKHNKCTELTSENTSTYQTRNDPSTSYICDMQNLNEIAENHNNENIEKSLLIDFSLTDASGPVLLPPVEIVVSPPDNSLPDELFDLQPIVPTTDELVLTDNLI